jgi:cyanamide hydratase
MVKDIPVPQSPLAEVVRTYAQQHLPEKTFNHSNRIFFWGIAIARAAFPHWKIDEETYYVTCLLHDIGLADAFHLTTKMSFEVCLALVLRRCETADVS